MIGRGAGGGAGTVTTGAVGTTAGAATAVGRPGWDEVGVEPGVGTDTPGAATDEGRPAGGTVAAGPVDMDRVVGVVVATRAPDANSLTTSWWATTGVGRSVTSAATIDVAVQTMAVDAKVTTSHRPTASNRDSGICPG